MTNTQKQTIIEKMSTVRSQEDLASVLEYVGKDVLGYKKWYSLNQIRSLATGAKNLYRSFTIPKKSGGIRTITAPRHDLKAIQDSLNKIFQVIFEPSRQAYGFIVGKSVADNAAYHVGQRYVFNIDLKDFFPSIEKRRLIARLKAVPFSLPTDVALLIAGLSCYKGGKDNKSVLPQGSPVSPTFSNIIAERLDRKLNKLANRYGARYSRYADDITFSSMNNIYRPEGDFYNAVWGIVAEEGFTINEDKVRLNRVGERLEITGLTVSNKVNVARKYVNDLRWMIYHWERDGYNNAYSIFIRKYTEAKTTPIKGTPDMQNVIAGKLDYLKMVKGKNDSTYLKLKERFDALVNGYPIDRTVSDILDIWEKDGIEAAMAKYYSSENGATEVAEALPAYKKYPRLEKYSLDAFGKKYNSSLSFNVIDGKMRAFIDGKPSFHGHPIYVAKDFDENDRKVLVELIQGDRAKYFWYISNNKFENNTENTIENDTTPLNRISFNVKPVASVTPIQISQESSSSTNKSIFESLFFEKKKYDYQEIYLSRHLAYKCGSSLESVEFIYPDSLDFCAIECTIQNNATKGKKCFILTPRRKMTETDILKLKEYHTQGLFAEIVVRIGRQDSSHGYGCPRWCRTLFFEENEGLAFGDIEPHGEKHIRILKDARLSSPTVRTLEDFKTAE